MSSTVDATVGVECSSNETVLSKSKPAENKPTFVFVLGGPGGGKSTQCSSIAKQIGFTHLSTGELLRQASKLDPENQPMIDEMIKDGLSVPPDVTMRILKKAIEESGNDKFLLDGFPRDEEIRTAFEAATAVEPKLVLFFDCSEEERKKRSLRRKEGRVDDNDDSLRKRFKYFQEHTLPVIEHYKLRGKVSLIDAEKPEEEVSKIFLQTMKSFLSPTIVQFDEGEANSEAPDNVGIIEIGAKQSEEGDANIEAPSTVEVIEIGAIQFDKNEAKTEATADDEAIEVGGEAEECLEIEREHSVLQSETEAVATTSELTAEMSNMKL